jgi:hypothetical protein
VRGFAGSGAFTTTLSLMLRSSLLLNVLHLVAVVALPWTAYGRGDPVSDVAVSLADIALRAWR